jgi:uncharacterized protein (TIGR00369 family)
MPDINSTDRCHEQEDRTMSDWPTTIAERIASSPLSGQLHFSTVSSEPNKVVMAMPFRHEHTTMGDQVHGGAIAALIDTVATATAWSGVDPENPPSRGTTVNLEVNFMAAARSVDLIATGTIPRRGRSICFCHVDVHDRDANLIAQGRAVYKIG